MNINAPLSIRRRMGLEIFRRLENERTEEHQLKQLFGNVLFVVICIVDIVAVIVKRSLVILICRRKIFFGCWIVSQLKMIRIKSL